MLLYMYRSTGWPRRPPASTGKGPDRRVRDRRSSRDRARWPRRDGRRRRRRRSWRGSSRRCVIAIAELSWLTGAPVKPPPKKLNGPYPDFCPSQSIAVSAGVAGGVERVDDPAALDLDPGHVRDVGVVDQAAVAGVGQVVVGQRVAADVDVAAVAGRGRGQRSGRRTWLEVL